MFWLVAYLKIVAHVPSVHMSRLCHVLTHSEAAEQLLHSSQRGQPDSSLDTVWHLLTRDCCILFIRRSGRHLISLF